MRKKIVAVIGDGKIEKESLKYEIAFNVGKKLIDSGYRIQTGGLGGIMSAVLEGAKSSTNYMDGDTIAIIPSFDINDACEFADIVLPTGLDIVRNALVVNASAVIVIGGGAGTLSEMAMAWSLFKLIIAFDNVDGWGAKLSGQRLDNRKRYDFIDDRIFGVDNVEDMSKILAEKMELYTRCHHGIKERK